MLLEGVLLIELDGGLKVFSEQGKITDEILMLDAFGWNHQKTTSTYIISGKRTAIIEPASRGSAKRIRDGLKKFSVDQNSIHHVFVSHRHFDHAAGGPPLLKYLPNASMMAHQYTIENYKDPRKINEAAKRIFGEFAEPIEVVEREDKLIALREGDTIDLGGGLEIETVYTPGHASDHFACYERKNKFMFTGDSAGLFGVKTLSITPTAFPPSFKYKNYVKSIEKMLEFDLKIVAFAHFGAVAGPNATEILEKSLEATEEFKNLAEAKWRICKNVDDLAELLRSKYQNKLEVFPKGLRKHIYSMLATGLVESLFGRGQQITPPIRDRRFHPGIRFRCSRRSWSSLGWLSYTAIPCSCHLRA